MKLPRVYLAIFFGVLCMSTASIMIRFCSAPALIIALYRLSFTALMALPLAGKEALPALRALSRRDLGFMLGAGFLLALHFAFWITSLSYTSVSSSVLFTNLQVIFVLIFSILFLKEKLNVWIIGGILIALIGSACVAGGDLHQGRLAGDMLALLSGLFMAIYLLVGRRVRPVVGAMTYTMMVSGAAAIVLLLGSWLGRLSFTGFPLLDWLLFMMMALIPGIAGHGVLNWALKYVKAPIVAVSILGESVGASILAYFIFNELLQSYQIIGGVLILTGIYTAAVNDRRAGPE